MRRIGICVLAVLLSQTVSVSAVTCEEGIRILDFTDTRTLSTTVRQIIRRASADAKQELARGNEYRCKLIIADAMRFLIVRDEY